jgi:hypothetical protein
MMGPIPESEYTRYESERLDYLAALRPYLVEAHEHKRIMARVIPVHLDLRNTGSAPATDIDVYLDVPQGIQVATATLVEEEPEPPEPPRPPRPQVEILGANLSALVDVSALRPEWRIPSFDYRSSMPPNVSSWEIEEVEGGCIISCHVRRLKHGRDVALPTFYLQLPHDTNLKSFQIRVSLGADNLPDEVKGELNVVLTSQ